MEKQERHLTRTAVFIILEQGNKVLFLRRCNTGWADGLLTVPTGHVDKGDSVIEACVKEVEEEVGLSVRPEDLSLVHSAYIKDAYAFFFFRTTKWKGEPKLGEPHLSSELVWVDKNALSNDVVSAVRETFEMIEQGITFSDRENKV